MSWEDSRAAYTPMEVIRPDPLPYLSGRLPPTAGFMGNSSSFLGSSSHFVILACIGMVTVILSVYFYFKIIVAHLYASMGVRPRIPDLDLSAALRARRVSRAHFRAGTGYPPPFWMRSDGHLDSDPSP